MAAKRLFAFAFSVFISAVGVSDASDQIPGAKQSKPILIRNATIHTVSGATLPHGALLLRDGKIAEIGNDIAAQDGFEVIDAGGKHVYPGLIDSNSSLGLVEIDSIRASIDSSELGNINPNVRAVAAFNPDSEAIPVARSNGILMSVVSPNGGLVSGRAAVMLLDGWTWEDMTLQADTAMIVSWPRSEGRPRGPRQGPEEPREGEESAGDPLAPLHELMRTTSDYAKAKATDPNLTVDLRLEAMIPVVQGKQPIMAIANSVGQIRSAIAFCKRYKLKLVIYGGADAMECVELIKETNTPIVLSSVYRLPTRRDAGYDSMYALPGQLQKAGIRFSIGSEGRFGASAVRNLPYNAAAAIAFGLSPDEALRSITLSPAEIFGIADRVGSLDVGKDATLFLCNGDILDVPTQVEKAWVQGRTVDLSNKQTQLYEKYKAKYQSR